MKFSSRIETVFFAALEKGTAEERSAFLDEACAGDEALRNRLERMLEAQDESFLNAPADGLPAVTLHPVAEKPGDVVGPYKLVEKIGEGGFGVVFRAEQIEPVRREVALKIIKPGMDTKDVVTRFEAERQALAMMDHPHIAKVFDAGTTDTGRPYFAMELVKGIAITEYCDQCNLPTRERLELFIQVCQAVQHAHQKGVIHRDLKPTNVLVAMQDGHLMPKIIDFGVAKAIEIRLTEQTLVTAFAQMVGTPMYMSPEQAQMSPLEVDTRTDVYSLGVLLYELLTGTTPFEKERFKEASFDELRRIIREEEPPVPSSRISTLNAAARTTAAEHRHTEPHKLGQLVRGELDWIVMKCLEKDRHRRYASAKDLADDIERYLADDPVTARPTSTIYRLGKFTRRNRGLVVAVAAVLVTLCLGLVTTTAGFLTAQRRLVQVEQERANYETVTQLIRDMYDVPPGRAVETEKLNVGDLLDELSSGLNERAPERPTVEIELRRIVASMYLRIGQRDKAKEHLRRALELAEGEGGYDPHEEKYADLLVELAGQFQGQDTPLDPAESADYAERALAIYDELGIQTEATAHACYLLAWARGSMTGGVPHEGEALHRRELEIAERLADEHDPVELIFALEDMATFLTFANADGSEEAIGYAQRAVDLSERTYGNEDPLTATTYRWLGQCYFRQGYADTAIEYYKKSWLLFQETGREHEPEAHKSAFRLAEAYLFVGRHNDANRVCDELEGICLEQNDWEWLAQIKALRGWGEFVRGDYLASVQILTETVNLADEHLGPYHEVQGSRGRLGTLLDELGRHAEAREEQKKIMEVAEAWASASKREYPKLLWASARSVIDFNSAETAAGRSSLEEALHKAKRGLEIVRASPPLIWEAPFLWVQAMAEHKLNSKGDAIQTMEEAIRHITQPFPAVQGHSGMAQGDPSRDISRARREMEATLAAFYLEAGRFEDAEQVYVDGIKFRESFTEREFPAKALQLALAELRYGEFLVEHGKFNRAEEPLRSAYEELSNNPDAAPATAQRAAVQLVRVYEETKRSDEAIVWRQKVNDSDQASDEKEER